jgi:C4-dicarboxylate-specific signal transduction histidine kinase
MSGGKPSYTQMTSKKRSRGSLLRSRLDNRTTSLTGFSVRMESIDGMMLARSPYEIPKERSFNGTVCPCTLTRKRRAEGRLRELRAELARASRVATAAELSASIAHELNQPLTSVLANAQACSRWLAAVPPKIREAVVSVERIIRDGRAAGAAMRNIRALFEDSHLSKLHSIMVELIDEVVRLFKEDAASRVTPIECNYEEPVFTVLTSTVFRFIR